MDNTNNNSNQTTPVVTYTRDNAGNTIPINPQSPITSSLLNPNGTPYTLPNNTPQTSASGLSAGIASATSAVKTASDQAYQDRVKAQDTKKLDLAGMVKDIMGTNTDIANVQSTVDRTAQDKAKMEADKYTSLIEAEQLANRRQIEDLSKNNPEGLFGGALQDKINNINRDSVSKQADYAILQNSALRNFDTAKAIADRQVDMKLEPLKAKLDNLKFFYQSNKDDFTKEDDRLYQERIKKEDLALQKQTDLEKKIADIKVSVAQSGSANPAMLDALSKIDTSQPSALDQVIKLAGKYMPNANAEFQKVGDNLLRIDKATGKVLNNYGSGSTGSAGSVPSSVVRTVQTTEGAKPVSGYSLKAGDDPYFIAKQYGTDMETLKKLNPSVQDWTKLPVGTVLNVPNDSENWLNGKTQEQVAAYNAIPDSEKASIKQLINGDALLTDIVKSRGAKTQAQINQIISQATAVDPKFSVQDNIARVKYKQQFNNPNGKEQLQINSINTGLGHLAEFKSAADDLGNTIALPYNKLVNYLEKNTGDPKVVKLNTVITALAGELAAVYKGGTAPTDQETKEWRNSILASFSQSQSAGVAATTANLISNKMLSLNNSYKNVMGSFPENPIINRDVVQQLVDSGVDISSLLGRLKQQGYDFSAEPSIEADNSTLSNYGLGSIDTGKDNILLNSFGL